MHTRIIATISSCLLLLAIIVIPSYGEQREIGIFLQHEKNCAIQDGEDKIPCSKGLGVRDGDIIITAKNPDSLKIQWISKSVKAKRISSSTLQVAYAPPAEKRGVVRTVLDVLGFARASSHTISMAATRGASPLLPGKGSTLLSNTPVVFSGWDSNATKLVIRNEAGHVMVEQPLNNQKLLVLIPLKNGLICGKTYTWQTDGNQATAIVFKILDQPNTAVVSEVFETIDANASLSANDRIFAKAATAQHLSESYPEEISLNWLAYQLIDQMQEIKTAEDKAMASYLKARSEIR